MYQYKNILMIKDPNQFQTEKHSTEECINGQGLQVSGVRITDLSIFT